MSMTSQLTKILTEVDMIVAQGIQERVFPGAALWIGWQGESVKCAAYGKTADREYGGYNPVSVTTKTLYDLSSLTKVVVTTCSVLQLAERGLLRLVDPIATYIPQFGTDPQRAAITIEHVLNHTSGLPGPLKLYEHYRGERQIIEAICRQKPVFPPGDRYLYSDLGFILLGEVVRVVSSLRLDEYAHRYVFEPMEMKDTMFTPPKKLKERIAPSENVEWRGGLIHGKVHDENALAMGGVAGHAGLFSTVEDLAHFCMMILSRGAYRARRILDPRSVLAMESMYRSEPVESYGLGWVINAPYFMGNLASPNTVGHTGFTGTSIMLRPNCQLAIVLLSNRVCPTRNGPSMNPYRRKVADALAKLD